MGGCRLNNIRDIPIRHVEVCDCCGRVVRLEDSYGDESVYYCWFCSFKIVRFLRGFKNDI